MTATPEIVMAPRARLGPLFPDLLRPLTERERERLADSLREDGVLAPLHVDEAWGVIDGGHRLQIAEEQGILALPVKVHRGLSPDQKRKLAVALNVARRHLTPEEQQAAHKSRVPRVAAKKQAGQSTREIAAEEGISQTQVQQDLKEAIEQGCSIEPEGGKTKRKGGGTYPASRKKEATVPGGTVEPESGKNGTPPAPEPLWDALGREVPDAARPAFLALQKFRDLEAAIARAARLVNDLCESPGGEELKAQCRIHASGQSRVWRLERLRNALLEVRQARPWSGACPHCHPSKPRPDCGTCKGRGWTLRRWWEAAAEDLRKQAELSRPARPGPAPAPQEEGDEE
jgi:hypothetical protein